MPYHIKISYGSNKHQHLDFLTFWDAYPSFSGERPVIMKRMHIAVQNDIAMAATVAIVWAMRNLEVVQGRP